MLHDDFSSTVQHICPAENDLLSVYLNSALTQPKHIIARHYLLPFTLLYYCTLMLSNLFVFLILFSKNSFKPAIG